MTEIDLLILAVYILTVIYVLYEAFNSLENQTTFEFDRTAFDRALDDNHLRDVLDVKFGFDDRYKFEDQPKKMGISIENKSSDIPIEVDWDQSSLTDYSGRSRRVIRLTQTTDKQLNLSEPQVIRVVAPGRTLKEDITAEDVLKANVDGSINIASPLIDLGGLEKAGKKSDKLKQLYAEFMEEKAVIRFSLRLAIRLIEPVHEHMGDRRRRFYFLPCDFVIKKVPWTDALPFNPKK